MVKLAGLVLSIGLADSLNPSTVGPGIFLATRPHAIRRICEFAAGFAAVNLGAGILLALGPGQLLFTVVPHPGHTVKHVLEIGLGVVLEAVALGLWLGRRRLASGKGVPGPSGAGSSLIAGASIAAVELPTAVPYFAVIGVIVGSDASVPGQVALLAAFNLAFVAPLLLLAGGLAVAGERADRLAERAKAWLDRHWPTVLAGLLAGIGAVALAFGIAGVAGS